MARDHRAVTYVLKPDAFPTSTTGISKEFAPGGRRQHGFIAQEVEHVAPEVVDEDGNGYKTVAYSRLVPTLAAALSSALDRLDRLEEPRAAPAFDMTERASSSANAASTIDELFNTDPSAFAPDGGREISGYGDRSTIVVGKDGQQATRELDSGRAEIDVTQLWVENTALRGRVGEMETRMAELERKLESVALVGSSTGMSGSTASNEPTRRP